MTGQAIYAAEDLPEGCAFGVLVRAPGSGRASLRNEQALAAMPGALAVRRDKAMIRRTAQGASGDAPVQGVDVADFVGQSVALIVAESFEAARDAARAADVVSRSRRPATLPMRPNTG